MHEMEQENVTYIPHKKDKCDTSVWYYFLKAIDGRTARCKQCNNLLKTLGGSTKGLHTHLISKHNKKMNLPESSNINSNEREMPSLPPTKRKISNYFLPSEKSSCDKVLARMTALDGLSFNFFVNSHDLRQLLISKGYNDLPTSVTTIRNRVVNYSLQIRERLIKEICQYKAIGKRFSLTFDEWTSTANKRYMNINVHCKEKFWSLGLIRIHGSMSAEKCKDILQQRLHKHNISLAKDIVAIVTDGPNIMLKVGRIVEAEHHLCLAHGIHLSVCDVLYNKNKDTIISQTSTNETVLQIEDDGCNSDDDIEEDFTCLQMGLDFEPIYKDVEISNQNENNINELVKKVRKTVLLFKRSSTKNDSILQKYVKSEKGKELTLLLDCKTRILF